MRSSDWSADVCASDLAGSGGARGAFGKLDHAATAARGGPAISRVAGRPFSRSRGQGDAHRAIRARQQGQRCPLLRTDEAARRVGRPVSRTLPQGAGTLWHRQPRIRARLQPIPASRNGRAAAAALTAQVALHIDAVEIAAELEADIPQTADLGEAAPRVERDRSRLAAANDRYHLLETRIARGTDPGVEHCRANSPPGPVRPPIDAIL